MQEATQRKTLGAQTLLKTPRNIFEARTIGRSGMGKFNLHSMEAAQIQNIKMH